MILLTVLLLFVALLIATLYFFVFANEVPEVARERLGEPAQEPDDLGQWKQDQDSPAALAAAAEGLVREERVVRSTAGGWGSGRLVLQVRFRSLANGAIVRVEAERPLRRRVQKPSSSS